MKRSRYWLSIVALSALGLPSWTSAQTVPNGGFEEWTEWNPIGWSASNDVTPWWKVITVMKSTDSHSGSAAVRGEVTPNGQDWANAPLISSQPLLMNNPPRVFQGWYKCSLLQGAILSIDVTLFYGHELRDTIGGGKLNITTSAGTYQPFSINLNYALDETPDVVISMTLSGPSGRVTPANVGSYFLVDDLSFGLATAVDPIGNSSPDRFSLEQNFPNPFNPSTRITYQLPAQDGVNGKAARNVRLTVYDMLGREVATLVDGERSAGTHEVMWDASGVSSGVHIYRLVAGDFVASRKMILAK